MLLKTLSQLTSAINSVSREVSVDATSGLFQLTSLNNSASIDVTYNHRQSEGVGGGPSPPPLFAKSGLKMHPRGSIFQNFLEHNI